jgi:2,3-bisphosphoglycerate-independent phosphoglycerate mutase
MVINTDSVPSDIRDLLMADPLQRQKIGTDPATVYRLYDNWPLEKAADIVTYMRDRYPGQVYLLVISVGGTDMAAHEKGYGSYRQAIEDLDSGLALLADACKASGDVFLITADHGMSFKSPGSKGSHASGEASQQNESRLVPLLVFSEVSGTRSGIFGQECLAPTLLSLMECPDTLSVEDGEPIPVSDSPSLYLISDVPAAVSVTGPGLAWQATVNGTCRIGPLSKGRYMISSPAGTRVVELDRDQTIKIADCKAAVGWKWDWLPCAAVAMISVLGLVVALRLLKRR